MYLLHAYVCMYVRNDTWSLAGRAKRKRELMSCATYYDCNCNCKYNVLVGVDIKCDTWRFGEEKNM